jgi:hypothetical protein
MVENMNNQKITPVNIIAEITRRKLISSFTNYSDDQKLELFLEKMDDELIQWHVKLLENERRAAVNFSAWMTSIEENFTEKKMDIIDLCSIKLKKNEKISSYIKNVVEK